MEVLRSLQDDVEGLTGLLAGEVVARDLSAAAGVDQVVEAGAVDLFALDEVEDPVQVGEVVAGQRQAQADPLADADAGLEAAHRAVEGAAHAAKPVVDLPDPVQADPDVREAGVLDLASGLVGDQRAVGGEGRPDAEGAGVRDQVEEVGPGQRLAAGEEEGGDLEVRPDPG